MFRQLLANGRGIARVGLNGADVGRRRWQGDAEKALQHPIAAKHRRSNRAVGRHLQNRRLGQHAAAHAVGGQRDFLNLLPHHVGNVVSFGEAAVDHNEIGVDEVADAEIFLQNLVKKRLGLGDHRKLQRLVVFGIKRDVGPGRINVAHVEPLAEEVAREALRLRAAQHPLGLGAQHAGLGQFLGGGQ